LLTVWKISKRKPGPMSGKEIAQSRNDRSLLHLGAREAAERPQNSGKGYARNVRRMLSPCRTSPCPHIKPGGPYTLDNRSGIRKNPDITPENPGGTEIHEYSSVVKPSLTAYFVRCATLRSPSLDINWLRCVSTVLAPMCSAAAISLLVWPSASN
jgi:hypothetical protein